MTRRLKKKKIMNNPPPLPQTKKLKIKWSPPKMCNFVIFRDLKQSDGKTKITNLIFFRDFFRLGTKVNPEKLSNHEAVTLRSVRMLVRPLVVSLLLSALIDRFSVSRLGFFLYRHSLLQQIRSKPNLSDMPMEQQIVKKNYKSDFDRKITLMFFVCLGFIFFFSLIFKRPGVAGAVLKTHLSLS